MWQETMDAEFGSGKFKRLFRGPMWSGCDRQDVGDPRKVNIKRINDYANFACTAAVQQLEKTMLQSSVSGGSHYVNLV